ncbi:MAG: AAA family ATPase [Oscillospiraceae bacterium]|nr:AAA family ATPase [Candidatus Limimonas coprohippi]MCQ2487861.1 AAA family ATPase [Clostridia bacterium]
MSTFGAKKVLFTSGKGGVGKSTLSTAFAKILCAEGYNVLMVDCDVCLRTLDIMLSVSSLVLYDWYDVIEGNVDARSAMITTGGPKLLAAPTCEVDITAEKMEKLLRIYERDFDYIILDCPAGVGEVFDACLAVSDLALIVTTPDNVCVRSASVAAAKADAAGKEVRLLINRFQKGITSSGRALNLDEVIDATGVQLIGVIPEDKSLVVSMLNGELVDPNTKSIKAMERVIKRLNGEYIPLKI